MHRQHERSVDVAEKFWETKVWMADLTLDKRDADILDTYLDVSHIYNQ